MESVVNMAGRNQYLHDLIGGQECILTDIFRKNGFADQVEELDLYATQILSDFVALHFAQAYPQGSQ